MGRGKTKEGYGIGGGRPVVGRVRRRTVRRRADFVVTDLLHRAHGGIHREECRRAAVGCRCLVRHDERPLRLSILKHAHVVIVRKRHVAGILSR